MKILCRDNSANHNKLFIITLVDKVISVETLDNFYFRMFYTEGDRYNKTMKELQEFIKNNDCTKEDVFEILKKHKDETFDFIPECIEE